MDKEKIRKEWGYQGKPLQWRAGFDAALSEIKTSLMEKTEPVAEVPCSDGLVALVEEWRSESHRLINEACKKEGISNSEESILIGWHQAYNKCCIDVIQLIDKSN